jgi:protein-disulfide isomerase
VSVTRTTAYGINLTGSPVMGKQNTNTPIDIYYWYDYQCSYCKQFEMGQYGALPKLVRNEITNGTARLILLLYPNYGPHSMTAAVMAKCLWRQVKDRKPDLFWKWHHTAFSHQQSAGGAWSSRKNLLGYAQSIPGIDARAIDQCMQQTRAQLKADVRKERKRARKQGFSQTPGFVLYNPKTKQSVNMQGAQPYNRFQHHISSLLKQ